MVLLDEAMGKATSKRSERDADQLNLFAGDSEADSLRQPSEYPEVPPFSSSQQLKEERDLLGVYLSGHPLDQYSHLFNRPEVHAVSALSECSREQTVKIVGMITEEKRIQTKKGEPMAFLMLEDKTAQVETVVFPKVYAKYAELLKKEQVVVAEARIDHQDDIVKLIANRFWDAASLPKPSMEPVLFVKISAEQEHDSTLHSLQRLFVEKRGTIPVVLYYEGKRRTIRLPDAIRVEVDESFLEQAREIVGRDSVIQKELPVNGGG